jgi:hypothetical protein
MKKLALLFAILLGVSSIANAISISIGIGDEPYYIHGPGFWSGGLYYVWIPGHWCGWRHHHHIWCHGHYAVR